MIAPFQAWFLAEWILCGFFDSSGTMEKWKVWIFLYVLCIVRAEGLLFIFSLFLHTMLVHHFESNIMSVAYPSIHSTDFHVHTFTCTMVLNTTYGDRSEEEQGSLVYCNMYVCIRICIHMCSHTHARIHVYTCFSIRHFVVCVFFHRCEATKSQTYMYTYT
jgi:hypothetical protein